MTAPREENRHKVRLIGGQEIAAEEGEIGHFLPWVNNQEKKTEYFRRWSKRFWRLRKSLEKRHSSPGRSWRGGTVWKVCGSWDPLRKERGSEEASRDLREKGCADLKEKNVKIRSLRSKVGEAREKEGAEVLFFCHFISFGSCQDKREMKGGIPHRPTLRNSTEPETFRRCHAAL